VLLLANFRKRLAAIGLLGACTACHNNPAKTDAPIDMSTIDSECGADLFYTGEVIDWDSSGACGVFMAKMQVHGDPSRVSITAPNGRFRLCLPAGVFQADLTPPTDQSQCTNPRDIYQIPGIAIASKAVIDTGRLNSLRMLRMGEVASFYATFGSTYNPTKAGVFVHVEGTTRAVSIAASSDPPQARNTSWAAGNTGAYVFFPNVDPAAGTTTVSVAGGAIGEGAVPLVANTFTYTTVVAN
jgi:hypothetical protein